MNDRYLIYFFFNIIFKETTPDLREAKYKYSSSTALRDSNLALVLKELNLWSSIWYNCQAKKRVSAHTIFP